MSNSHHYEAVYQLPPHQGPYPIDAFPAIIRQAVEDIDAELGGGVELGASAALGVVSIVCQEFVNVQRLPKLNPTSCSLFLITVAGTGAGKSEIQGRFTAALDEFERKEELRARDASEESSGLSPRARLGRLKELRAERQEIVAEYDELRARHTELQKIEKKVRVEVKKKREWIQRKEKEAEQPPEQQQPHERQDPTALARMERTTLEPNLKVTRERLAKVEAEIRSAMGPNARRLVYGRGSFAGFRNGLQDKCRSAGIISAEAGGILNSSLLTRNMDAWNELWGCEFYRETYDKREYVIESPRLTLALMLQPKQFERFIDNYGENALDNGFLSRTLLLKVPSYPARLAGGDTERTKLSTSLEQFHRRVGEILEQDFPWLPERTVLKLTGKARRYWENYYNVLTIKLTQGSFDREMEGFVRKLPEQAARIAALFHYFEHYPIRTIDALDQSTGTCVSSNHEISLDTIRSAVRLCDWYMAEFRNLVIARHLPEPFSSWVYSTQVRTNADKIYSTIQKNYRELQAEQGRWCVRMPYRVIQNNNRTIKDRGGILAALHCLASEGRVHLAEGPNKGVHVCFNPLHRYSCGQCHISPSKRNPLPMVEKPGMHPGRTLTEPISPSPHEAGSPEETDNHGNQEGHQRSAGESGEHSISEDGANGQSLLEVLMAFAPSVFNRSDHPSRSEMATRIDTSDTPLPESQRAKEDVIDGDNGTGEQATAEADEPLSSTMDSEPAEGPDGTNDDIPISSSPNDDENDPLDGVKPESNS